MPSLSNRDRVGRAFELLRDGLQRFIDQTVEEVAPGADWGAMLSEIRGRSVDPGDVQTHLVLLTEKFASLFKDRLPYAARNYASELRDQRNDWAHMKPFSNDDAHRMLENAERLLTLTGAPQEAEQVRRSRLDHQRRVFEAETKKLARQQETSAGVPGQGLQPWREVLAPHDDVASGNFSASEFAADLHMVAFARDDRTLGQEYGDPAEFFRRTYLTDGLWELLDRAVRRLTGDANARPIINLQTNFGGGKTHSMLALWHLFSGTPLSRLPQDVQDLVGDRSLPGDVRRVALVGTHLSPGEPSLKPDGTEVCTLWGELAWQLGKKEAFARVSNADAKATNPGGVLRELIEQSAPCVILIDEWVAYARQLWGREGLPGGTFDTQFTFAQTLTEVVKTVPGALLVISIPASHDPSRDEGAAGSSLEVGGPNGQEALHRLQNVVRRVADQWRPASSEESFEIVRRRLFTEPDAEARAAISSVARQFSQFYAGHTGEFPREVTADPAAYERRIKAAYPIHPELFDRLYEDWSTLERFQRTRGVLRLMSSVVHALWTAQDAAPMILPGSVPLDVPTVASEITQYLPDAWKPIIDRDVDGQTSIPARIDAEKPLLGARAVTRRIARSIFVGSAPTVRTAHRGLEKQRIWLGTAIPGDVVGNFGSGLDVLSQRATYLYAEGTRFWFDTQPSVTRTAADYADALREKPEVVWREIQRRLADEQRHRGGFAAVHVAPDSSAEVPDADEVRLVILAASYTHARGQQDSAALEFARDVFEHRGTTPRVNRNMLVFLAPDSKRMEDLSEAVRDYLAWTWVEERMVELNLTPQQQKQVGSNVGRSDEAAALRVAQTYHWALVPDQPDPAGRPEVMVEKAESANPKLAERVTEKLTRLGMLTGSIGAPAIRLDLDQKLGTVWQGGHIKVGDLWSYYCRYPYLTRLRDRGVLVEGVLSVLTEVMWESQGFAVAVRYDEKSARYEGLSVPGGDALFGEVTDATLLVRPQDALRQTETEREATEQAPTPVDHQPTPPGHEDGEDTSRHPHNVRFYGTVTVDPERYGRELARVSQEVLQQLAAVDGSRLQVTLEIHASTEQGFPDDKVRTILENANVLKFTQASFEDE